MQLYCEELLAGIAKHFQSFAAYPESFNSTKGCLLFLARANGERYLFAADLDGKGAYAEFQGRAVDEIGGKKIFQAELNHPNATVLRRWFPFTAPVPFGTEGMSMGLGDRLGLASPGHLRVIRKTKVRPVLAQQSIRELNLTNRTYEDVLDAASWAVFQEGYRLGFGADGDHLKNDSEVKMALDLGFSMITLDCSEKIDNEIDQKTSAEIDAAYAALPVAYRELIEARYLKKTFTVGSFALSFSETVLRKLALIYHAAIDFTGSIYESRIQGKAVDFELSIDETATPTSPEAHYFVASELQRLGIRVSSLAPRFCGEFQKAIDYIGDLDQFEQEFKIHAAIADEFGYRLSIHSGSDKFRVFPIIGKYTHGRVHVKTAGTNWLEALRVISEKDPALFRAIYRFALEHFSEATKYYHVTTDLTRVPDADKLTDAELGAVLAQGDARQVLHITYGLILQAKTAGGQSQFRDALYACLNRYEEEYAEALERHIERHLQELQRQD